MRSTTWIAIVLGAAAMYGCKNEEGQTRSTGDFFLDDDANRTVWRAIEKQAAAGAAEDGMLYGYHFEGSDLSDLGREKLDLMVRADQHPLKVYLDVPEDDTASARQASVSRYLAGAGLSADAMQIKMGPNPSASTPAAPNILRLDKTESPGKLDGNGSSGTGLGGDMDTSGISPSSQY
jgi:hypothetical protein